MKLEVKWNEAIKILNRAMQRNVGLLLNSGKVTGLTA